jgi:hypothetical protein
MSAGVHSRATCPSRFGSRRSTPKVLFRPCGFAPLRRFPPPGGSRACCIPLPVMRFAAFRARSVQIPPVRAGWRRCEIPAARLGPLEGCSPSTAVPRHRGRCLLAVGVPPGSRSRSIPLPGWRSCTIRTVASASRRCSVVGSVARPRRFRRGRGSVLPWASFPFKVLADDGWSAPLPPSTEPWPLNQDSKLRSHTCDSATSPCRLQAPRPVARKLGSAAPDGPVPGPRAGPPKRPRRARSALDNRRSGGLAPRTGRSCTEVRDRGARSGRNPFERFTRERVYAARHTWRPKPLGGDHHPRLLVGWSGAFEVCPEP